MNKYLLCFLLIVLSVSACSAQHPEVQNSTYALMLQTLLDHSVDELSVADLSKSEQSVVLLDARELNEFEVSHIENAQWIGYDDFDPKRVEGISKDEEIVVYCSVGYRSEKITEQLNELGYRNVRNLYGGIFEWINQGNSVINGGEETVKVHAYDRTWGLWLETGEKVY
ncbi:rhodanese-like domain-containing protein [Chitinophagales bacterium]|nr:rhodanese-like domain-containing protein [Chitinophagales bacterium]